MTTATFHRHPVTPLPPPPVRDDRPPAPARSGPGPAVGILEVILPSSSRLPSSLDIDPAMLTLPATAPPARGTSRTRAATAEQLAEEAADLRIERLRTVALAASVTALAVLSAGALRLAL